MLIVEFGSVITFTTPLSWDLWLWSVALGMGTLVWGQVLNCIPADKLPASFSWGESTEDYSNKPLSSGNANAASAGQCKRRRLKFQLVLCWDSFSSPKHFFFFFFGGGAFPFVVGRVLLQPPGILLAISMHTESCVMAGIKPERQSIWGGDSS